MTPAEVLLAYDPDDVKPGWIALVLVLLLALATFLLWRSMNTQLGRIKAPHRADLARPADAADENSVDVSETPPAEPQDESEPDRGDQEPPH
jgi:hypothetical protein